MIAARLAVGHGKLDIRKILSFFKDTCLPRRTADRPGNGYIRELLTLPVRDLNLKTQTDALGP